MVFGFWRSSWLCFQFFVEELIAWTREKGWKIEFAVAQLPHEPLAVKLLHKAVYKVHSSKRCHEGKLLSISAAWTWLLSFQ